MATAHTKGSPRFGHDKESIKQGFAEHLKYSQGVDRYSIKDSDRFTALAYAVRDRLISRWLQTQRAHHDEGAKRVYYLSLEFLMGRSMGNNIINLKMHDEVRDAMCELGYDLEDLRELEMDAGLGNGGLGRLASCFLDSLATMGLASFGYGLRYDFGIFRQGIENGYQVEFPDDWLRNGNPWEIERPEVNVKVRFGGQVVPTHSKGKEGFNWIDGTVLIGVAYDMPIVGYGGNTVNTLRLWSAKADEEFNFAEFNEGDYVDAVSSKVDAENLTKVLYPNDKQYLGKELRLRQQYFFVACSLADIIRRFKKSGRPWQELPDMAAIHLNDTHPAISVAELMRILVDEENVPWDIAWDATVRTMGYTNHTLMPEALERWPVPMFERLLPRHLQIIYEINFRFLAAVSIKFPGDNNKLRNMSIIEEGEPKMIRMAYLAIVGSHSTNGVAALHTRLLKERLVPDFASMWPERFNNKTNGITQRRWLLKANPGLSDLITSTIGGGWITDLSKLRKLETYANDKTFRDAFAKVKREAKDRLVATCEKEYGIQLDPTHMFDVQVKRIHEYKRQLLNALNIVILYNRIKSGRTKGLVPRTVLFGGKAAPGYAMAKLIIKLINNIGKVVNSDPDVNELLRVHFLPNYRVSLAERIFPASDLSEQISTAGTEASGTGNMKFMVNGALTLGTLDGANIEIKEEVGDDNIFIFGLTAEEVEVLRPNYDPFKYYLEDAEIKDALDLLFNGYFNFGEPGIFEPIRESLFVRRDQYFHMADLRSYVDAQDKVMALYGKPNEWYKKAILNVAYSGKFSSDRTISEYARDIWGVKPVKVNFSGDGEATTIDEAVFRE